MSYDQKDIRFGFKTVICGASSVGKTCLFNRYCFNSFNFDTSPTIGINFHSVYLKINLAKESNTVKENYVVNSIFDFGGQERFAPLIPKFIEGANGALLVFDSVNYTSFNQLDFWYNQIIESAAETRIPIILVGSKSDLIDKTSDSEIVSDELIFKFLKSKNLNGFYITSAKENYNVLEVFKKLNNLMLKKQHISYAVV
ncbi:MAG: GTP-binding protein [Candidatus Lokiarchaeota archaeon]|nr:GTP-binding protein [Candidatus Lokiarchaeota archaeon]